MYTGFASVGDKCGSECQGQRIATMPNLHFPDRFQNVSNADLDALMVKGDMLVVADPTSPSDTK